MSVDTSVVVAGLSPWHERHDTAREVLDKKPTVVGHVLVEVFSVLTRLPVPFRVPADLVSTLLSSNFPSAPLALTPQQLARFVAGLPQWQIRGGAVYDALIAVTAREAGATLLSLDRRALPTYLAVDAHARMI